MWNWIKKYRVEVILGCLLLYIAFLLFYNLGVQSFWIDEGFSSYVAKKMSIEGFYKSSYFLYEWLQALTFKIAGISDFTARFPSVILQLGSVFLMYLIPYKLTKNKYVGLISAAVFGFLYWELAWGRDARFYSLLQLIFLGGIASLVYWIEDKKMIYLNITILLAGIGAVFHPFLYILGAMLVVVFLLQYKKLWDFKSLFSKKYLSTWVLVIFGFSLVVVFGTLSNALQSDGTTNPISFSMRKMYFTLYNSHLREQLGILYPLGVILMVWAFVKRKYEESVLLFFPFLLLLGLLVLKIKLFHVRYVLLIYPLIVISVFVSCYRNFRFNKFHGGKYIGLVIGILGVIFTTNLQIIPRTYYYLDFTSPQPNFKLAYSIVPNGKNVISGFPILCDWYYSDRGKCTHAIRVDMVHDGTLQRLMEAKTEVYTAIPYVDDLSELDSGIYYFVIDDLTKNSNTINEHLYTQIAQYGKKIFENGVSYNKILVALLGVK